MLKICIYTGINADVTLEDDGRRTTTECEDRARILKQNSQLKKAIQNVPQKLNVFPFPLDRTRWDKYMLNDMTVIRFEDMSDLVQ